MKRSQQSVVGWLLVSMLLLPLLSVILGPGAAAQDPTPTLNLFAPSGAPPSLAAPGFDALREAGDGTDVIVERSRTVVLDSDLLPADPAQAVEWLTLNLFDDAVFDVARDGLESTGDGYVWLGHVEDVAPGQVTLVVDDGRVTGNIITAGALYQVRYAGSGLHVVRQVNQSAFPPEAEPLSVELPEAANEPAAATTPADDASTVDVLVAYTADARAYAGGTQAMQDLIYLAVAEANTSYANSAVTQRLRLVHAAEVYYLETGDIEVDLARLRQTGDSYMDVVHTWRDQYGADEVVLLVENGGGFCGISYMMDLVSSTFASWAFAAVQLDCATGYYSFAHELGHNMGARHDWYEDGSTMPYTHSHGYVNSAARWRTIMAYDLECADAGYNCQRLPYWSNPDVWYNGYPMGVPEGTGTGCSPRVPAPNCDADNRKTLNKTAYTVANFRQAVVGPPNTPTGLSAVAASLNSIELTWTDSSDDESGFEIERSPDGVAGWTWISSTAANVTAFTNTGLASNTRYYYRVRAFNAIGASDYSAVASATTLSGVGPLVYGGLRIDDDGDGWSSGDGDGFAECGETIELYAKLNNPGATASTVVATLDSADPYVTWPGNFLSSYGDIAAGSAAFNQDAFELALDPATPHGHAISLTLESLATNGGPWVDSFNLVASCWPGTLHFRFLPVVQRDYTDGFDSQFNGSADGWQAHSGSWWIQSDDWYTTGGLASAWATTSYERTFADLDYEAALLRSGCDNCAHGLLVRGTPQPLATMNRWAGGYGFYVTRDGSFAVFEYGAAGPVALQSWTATPAVYTGGTWNTLRVVASGSQFWFFVNGELVWLGQDDTYPAGQVGLALYRDAGSAYNQLWADSARLTTPIVATLDTSLSTRQRALNAASGDDPPGSDGLAR